MQTHKLKYLFILLPLLNFAQDFSLLEVDASINPIQAKVVDVDSDLDADIIGITTDDELIWYENTGNLNFIKHFLDQNSNDFKSVSVGDFEGDGDVDIFTVGFNNLLTAYINSGGNFIKTIIAGDMTIDNNDILSFPSKIEAVQLNDDSQIDFVISQNDISVSAKIFLSNSDLSYSYQNIQNTSFSQINLLGQVFDFENDGDLDFFFGSSTEGKLQIYTNEQSGFIMENELDLFHSFFDAVYADIDNDGDKDIIVAIGELGVEVFYNLGNNDFSAGNWLFLGSSNNPWSWVNSIKLFDYDGDGFLDLATASTFMGQGFNENFRLYLNDQNGWFNFQYLHQFGSPNEVFYFDMADIDGDGDQDFVIPSAIIDGSPTGYNSLSILLNNSTLSTVDYSQSVSIELFPNPTKGSIHIKTSFYESTDIIIYDLNARPVLSQNINGYYNTINLESLAPSIYFLKIKNQIFKIIKE